MKKIKFGALVLAILLAGSSFASCNKGGETTNTGAETPDTSKETESKDGAGDTESAEPDSATFELPDDVRFDGETFNLYIAHSSRKNDYISEEETGDLMKDAVFARNEAVKDRLGIDLNFVSSTLTTSGADQAIERDKISSLILAGDSTYDAYVNVQHTGMPGLINEGMFIDWNQIPYINLDKDWWYSNVERDICFGTKIFCMTGDYNLGTFSDTACLAFNKTMLDELELDYPYQYVFDGTWTHDKFVEYIVAATKDLNGDGLMDLDNDRYGFGGWGYEQYPASYAGYGGETLKKDDNNMPVLNIYSVQQNNIIDKLIELYSLPGAFREYKTYGVDDRMFQEGRLLFNDSFIGSIPGMRNYEDEIGFVPYPKLNEEQEDYYSRSANIGCLTYLPVTLPEERYELVGATLETLAYIAHNEVLPKYFDVLLTVQSTRDVESEAMIPIIKDSARFMDQAIGFDSSAIVSGGQNTLASYWASNKTVFEEKLATLVKTYK